MKFSKGNGVFHNLQANHLVRVRLCIAGKRDASKRLQRRVSVVRARNSDVAVPQDVAISLSNG